MDKDLKDAFFKRWKKFFDVLEQDKAKIKELEYNEFMNDACDDWERVGNNYEPLAPEEVDEVPFEVAPNPSDSPCARDEDN